MRIPATPPTMEEVLAGTPEPNAPARWTKLFGISPTQKGRYLHWDELRRRPPPDGLSVEEWWLGTKVARSMIAREIPLRDRAGAEFLYSTPDPVLELLHRIDRDASGNLGVPDPITNPQSKARYLQSSLIEEAITSSQLEGAATTRDQAKRMLRSGRKPADQSERMILNNYQAMQQISGLRDEPMSPDLILELHQIIAAGTMPPDARPPYFRSQDDGVAVYDDRDNVRLHLPPPAAAIEDRMVAMCDFANGAETGVFLHPVVKSVILHFWLAYDHPFVDGNGRTARALFYWSMLRQGYWLAEYLSISSILRKAPAQYGRSFLFTETDGNDLTYFLDAQLRVICQAIDQLFDYLRRKVEEIRQTERFLHASAEINHRQVALLGHALRHPGYRYTIESHRRSHAVTYQTARTDLLGLSSKGLLHKTRSGRTFVFTPGPDLEQRLENFA